MHIHSYYEGTYTMGGLNQGLGIVCPHPGEYNCCFFVGGLEFLAENHGKRTSQIARNSRPSGLKPEVDHRKALAANRYVAEQLAACWRGETASLAWIDGLHMASYENHMAVSEKLCVAIKWQFDEVG